MAFFQIEYSSDVLANTAKWMSSIQIAIRLLKREVIRTSQFSISFMAWGAIIILGPSVPIFSVSFVRLISLLLCLTLKMAGIQIPNYGVKYYDAIAKELPQVMQRFFPSMTKKREKTFIAGLSMGGYGSFKLALTTNNFACAGSFSGALGLSVEMITDETSESKEYWQGVFGDLEGKDIEQHKLVNLAKQHDKKTKFFAWCGLEDFLFDSQDKAVADLKALGLDIDYRTDHGRHEWYYWENN